VISFVSLVISVCVWGALGRAETPQQQRPVFRSGAVFVSVDAYPRRDGKIVEGLTKGDFEILEDGKPQSVEEFEFIRVEPFTPEAARRDPNTVEEANRQAADPHNRVFVVYLDTFHTGIFGSHYTRQPVLAFLRRTIGPNDLFGVMTPETPATQLTFGRRIETIESDLAKYWDWGEMDRLATPRSQYEGQLMVCPGDLLSLYREDASASNLEQMVDRLGNLRDERKNILFISEGWIPRRLPPPGSSNSGYPTRPSIGVGRTGNLGTGPASNYTGASDSAWCESQYLKFANIDFERRFRDLLERARRANVSFYPVDVGGLRTDGVPASVAPPQGMTAAQIGEWTAQYRAGIQRRLDVLQEMALGTDGKAIVNTNDLVSGVGRIADDLSAFYLLGYYSANSAADGKFRRIDVKVKQSGVKVSARRGYVAPTPALRKAELEAASKPVRETTTVELELARLSRLRTDARVYTSAVATSSGFDVVVELASTELSGGRWAKGGSVTVRVSPKGDDAKEAKAEGRIEAGGRGVLVKVPATPAGASNWRIRARVEGGEEPVDDEIEIVAAPAAHIGEPTVFRGGAGPRSPLRPVADFRFFRTERVHVEWTLAKPLDDCTARLLSRKGDPMPVPVTLTERTDGDRLVLAADVVLAPLADGDYVIELSATGGGGKIQKLLAFRVVR